jgi:hypothetical protein
VNSYALKLHAEVVELARAAVNVHAGLLPEYRGPNPIQWAILNDEHHTGVTMHHVTQDIDAGDIIARDVVPIHFGDTWGDVQARLAEATEAMLARELPAVLSGTSARRPQDSTAARTFSRRRVEDGLFTWSQPARRIYNLIRALVHPHPGAFYILDGRAVVLDRFLSIQAVLSLKYGAERSRPTRESIALVPNGGDRDVVEFAIHRNGGDATVAVVRLTDIDWYGRTAFLECEPMSWISSNDLGIHGMMLAVDIAFEDLGLTRLTFKESTSQGEASSILMASGFVRDGSCLTIQRTTPCLAPGP